MDILPPFWPAAENPANLTSSSGNTNQRSHTFASTLRVAGRASACRTGNLLPSAGYKEVENYMYVYYGTLWDTVA